MSSHSRATSIDEYVMKSPRSATLHQLDSPTFSRRSNDSDDSLRALELSDGPNGFPLTAARARSYSISGFDFQHDLLPLSASVSNPNGSGSEGTRKDIGVVNGIALIIGLQIGSGIFSSPGVVVANTQSVGASLVVWVACGLLAWTGASSFAELGSAIPLNGGAQAYLAYAYNPLVSYLFAWTAITALKPGGNGAIALIFAEYINRLFFHLTGKDSSPNAIPQWSIKLTACIAIVLVTFLGIAARSLGTRTAVIFTVIKVASLLLISVLGIVQLARGRASESFRQPLFDGTSDSPSAYALAIFSGLWALDGWDQVNYVGGEMRNPEKNIPRTIHFSMLISIILYTLTNVSYFVVLDKTTIGLSNTVALDFGRAILGTFGGSLFALIVAISCFGALHGSFFTSARLIYVAGNEGYLPRAFGRLHSTRGTPLNAMLLQAVATMAFIILGGGFRRLVYFAVVAVWFFYFLTVLGLIILRIKEPELPRPYKTWITTPLIFCAVALFLLLMPIIAAPLETLTVVGFILAGIPVYYLTRRPDSEGASRIQSVLSPFSAIIARLRGAGPSRAGFERVATAPEGETVELFNAAGASRR
ncbi:L-methionine transporter [Fomitiporia mediterranea MF3/22]|uniref:L-methionine transporter n=1 Tax=Fomitiporia mediterranea (strain MF3/22) TaxID=694068 RepID=UPI00044088CA|nr:L-methionine transporter [Fomitiporia mediterranea MF3/22]EJD02312.1 L-methionine transporter [Fomitiporia mediterranea MF3/22]